MTTEQANPRHAAIASWSTHDAVEAMLEGQMAAAASVYSQISAIAAAADAASERLGRGGRLIYAGAGTSGRIAAQDGVELGPTYGWPDERLILIMAGGSSALTRSAESAEDDAVEPAEELARHGVGGEDVVIGVAASGRTPFTIAAVRVARERGALTIGVSNNAATPLLQESEHAICAQTGGELVAGSTRMKAGTAQKIVLNLLSTATMIRLGGVYDGLMVKMRVSNQKLQTRAEAIVARITGASETLSRRSLEEAGNDISMAVLIAQGLSPEEARARLQQAGGRLDRALQEHEIAS